MAFSTLAALLKISSAILFIAMALYVFYRKFIKKDQTYARANIFVTISGFLVVFGWLFFVHVYNNLGQYFGNLQGTFGVWLCDKNVFFYIFKVIYIIYIHRFYQYFYNMICRILVVMMICNNTSQKMKCDISELNYDF